MEMSLGMCSVVDGKEMVIQGARLSLHWDLQTDLGSDEMPFSNTSGDPNDKEEDFCYSFSCVETIFYRVER